MDDLRQRWAALAGTTAAAAETGNDLLRRWSEPHRHYHDVRHLTAVLDAIDQLAAEVASPTMAQLAAWFHDAVYQGKPGMDERASAALADEALTALGLPTHQVAEVVRLVLLTIAHDPSPGDVDGAVLCDADLAILGSPPGAYAAYAAAVRLDYADVPDEDFKTGRRTVLERLLSMNPMYRTATGRKRWEETARHNIATELMLLHSAR